MEPQPGSTTAPPRPRPFPLHSSDEHGEPGLRCGHTLTAITPEKNPAAARLVMFGETLWLVTCMQLHFSLSLAHCVCSHGSGHRQHCKLIAASQSAACAGGATALEGIQRNDQAPASPGPAAQAASGAHCVTHITASWADSLVTQSRSC